jgi:hypothetical protein
MLDSLHIECHIFHRYALDLSRVQSFIGLPDIMYYESCAVLVFMLQCAHSVVVCLALQLAFRDSTIAEEVQTSGTHQGTLTLPDTPNQRLDRRPLEFRKAVKSKAFTQSLKE